MKIKKCKSCGKEFMPERPLQSVCGYSCSIKITRRKEREKKEKQNRREKKVYYANDKRHQMKLTQTVFNAYIRKRDEMEVCISCGRHHDGQYHAGHLLTTAAHPELRFNELNCHKQCAPCNNHLSGNIIEYLPRLAAKIGQDKVDWLYNNQSSYKYTLKDVIEIREYYKDKLKRLNDAIL